MPEIPLTLDALEEWAANFADDQMVGRVNIATYCPVAQYIKDRGGSYPTVSRTSAIWHIGRDQQPRVQLSAEVQHVVTQVDHSGKSEAPVRAADFRAFIAKARSSTVK